MPSWSLVDADPIAAENKYTFYKPGRALIATIAPGHDVKLIFRFDSSDPAAPAAERMWVRVASLEADGSFQGQLNNQPVHIKDLQRGDPLAFDARHIINIEGVDEDDNLVERYLKRCLVSRRIVDDGCQIGYIYREAPGRDDDSGWGFMAGDESDEYLDQADNFCLLSLGRLLSIDDAMIDLLDAPVGAEFERDPRTGKFDIAASE
jgi:hypothetical protein